MRRGRGPATDSHGDNGTNSTTALAAGTDRLRLYDRALAATCVGVVIADARRPDMPLVFANPAFLRLTGYAASEVLGRNCRFLQGPGTDPEAVAAIRAALAAGRDCAVTLLNYRKDGAPFWNELSLSPVRDPGGAPTHYVGIQSDVTVRRRLEEEQARLLARAREARAAAEEAVRLRDDVLAAVAHDLKNPLAALKLQVQMLRRRARSGSVGDAGGTGVAGDAGDAGAAGDARLAEALARLDEAAAKMVGLVDDLLDVARLEGGEHLALALAPVDFAELARRAVAAQPVTESHRIEVTGVAPAPVVAADAARLERVLDNLLSNAVKYSPGGGPIAVRVERRGDQGVLAVEDRGVGIPAADLPHIFERFHRAGNVGHIGGTGLGLANARAIAEQHGGTLTVESAEGQGTMVTLSLPLGPGG